MFPRPMTRHFRLVATDGNPMPQGGVSVVARPMIGFRWRVGVAVCSLEDNFDRRLGRRIADGRALGRSHHILQCHAPSTRSGLEQALTVIARRHMRRAIIRHGLYPDATDGLLDTMFRVWRSRKHRPPSLRRLKVVDGRAVVAENISAAREFPRPMGVPQ